MKSEIFIKNMVCPRCITAVEKVLTEQNIPFQSVQLGKAIIEENLDKHKKDSLAKNLQNEGFELLDDKKTKISEQIKNTIVEFVHYQNKNMKQNLSDYLSSKFNMDYSSLSKLFSSQEKITIEKYLIKQKIERAKELLSYDEKTLNEIAYELNYSSSAYLSAQFKAVTGITPSKYKELKPDDRKSLDAI